MGVTIIQRAEIDLIGFNVGNDVSLQGQIAIRIAKLTYIDDRLIQNESDRVVVNPGDDIDATFATKNAMLENIGFSGIPASDVALVKLQTTAIWTPEIIAAYQGRMAELYTALGAA